MDVMLCSLFGQVIIRAIGIKVLINAQKSLDEYSQWSAFKCRRHNQIYDRIFSGVPHQFNYCVLQTSPNEASDFG